MKLKKLFMVVVCLIFSFVLFSGNASNVDDKIYLGGMPAGFSINSRGAYVSGLTNVYTENGVKAPAKDAGIIVGDIIIFIDNHEVNNVNDIEKALSNQMVVLTVEREDKTLYINVSPATDLKGELKLGIYVREGINGVGTITFIKGGKYASLGHPILDENNNVAKISGGCLYKSKIFGLIKGERGKAGELKGSIIKENKIGNILKNTDTGVYGEINAKAFNNLVEIELGECKIGDATIRSTIAGENPKEYSISIVKVENKVKDTKNIVIKITDEKLLEISGGIVQGMSGSPIIQNGKLVGAVTHVFINDPTRGFGISIDKMIFN